LIIAAVILLLFGARKLPEFARSIGKSAKAFKEETKGMRDEDKDADTSATASAQPAPPPQLPEARSQAQTNGAQPAAEQQPVEQTQNDKVEQAQQNKNAS
jgi:sec-independent protein translocase protein TatA